MHSKGVRFLAGTDLVNAYIFPGFSLHDELGLLVKSGLSNLEALQAATENAALFMGKDRDYGRVAAGAVADLLLLGGNPLDNIDNTRLIRAVVLSGNYMDRGRLDAMLSGATASSRVE